MNMNMGVVYVAVSQYVRESKSTLLWALRNLSVKKLYLLHVHIPISVTSSTSWLQDYEIDAIRHSDIETLKEDLCKYREICRRKGSQRKEHARVLEVNEEDVGAACIVGSDVGQGILQLIDQYNIKHLIMGAAADPHYSRAMSDITSRKAEYVRCRAPSTCKIWFICKGKLINISEGRFGQNNPSLAFYGDPGSAQIQIWGSQGRPEDEETESSKGNPVVRSETKHEEELKWIREEMKSLNKYMKKLWKKADSRHYCPVSNNPPEEYLCPISKVIMKEPHVAADGYSYEPYHFAMWLREGRNFSPVTLATLTHYGLTPNHNLTARIKDWLDAHPNYTG